MAAAGAGAGAEWTPFQIYIGSEFPLFPLIQPYTEYQEGRVGLSNCSNLSLVLLGIIENPVRYLQTCTERALTTEQSEINDILIRALAKGGYEHSGFDQAVGRNIALLPVNEANSFGSRLWQIGEKLRSKFATIVGFSFEGGGQHMAILLKIENSVFLIDPQIRGDDGSYPLAIEITEATQNAIVPPRRYIHATRQILAFLGPTIPKERAPFVKFDPTGKEGPIMNTSGGRRRVSQRQRKARKLQKPRKTKKTLKSKRSSR